LRLLRWSCRRASLGQSLVVLALHAPFLHRLFALGQIDALLLWLMVESESRAEGFISGLLWALACLFKPPFLIFLLLALAFRQWRRIAGLAFGLALGLAIDWRELPRWRELLEVTTRPMLCGDPENQGLVGIACHYLGGAIFAIPLAAALLALFTFASAKGGPKLAAASAFFLSSASSPWRICSSRPSGGRDRPLSAPRSPLPSPSMRSATTCSDAIASSPCSSIVITA